MKALVWRVATYGCESWTLRKNKETRLDAFEIKWLRKILRVSWTAKKTNEWVLNIAGVKRKLLDTVKARKLAYYGHTMRKQGSCLEKEIMQGTVPGARRRGRPRTAWMDNNKIWTVLSVEESIRMTEDRDKWRKYIHGVANPRIEDGCRIEQFSTRAFQCICSQRCARNGVQWNSFQFVCCEQTSKPVHITLTELNCADSIGGPWTTVFLFFTKMLNGIYF